MVVLMLPSLSLPVKADLKICNRTADPVTVAVGYVNPGGGFISEGWWTIGQCGGCQTVVLSRETSDPHNYWYYAQGWEGEFQLCTTTNSFKIRNRGNIDCEERRLRARGFNHVTSGSGNVTQNLTGGRRCNQ
jgi:uncharacterized membrane protein